MNRQFELFLKNLSWGKSVKGFLQYSRFWPNTPRRIILYSKCIERDSGGQICQRNWINVRNWVLGVAGAVLNPWDKWIRLLRLLRLPLLDNWPRELEAFCQSRSNSEGFAFFVWYYIGAIENKWILPFGQLLHTFSPKMKVSSNQILNGWHETKT